MNVKYSVRNSCPLGLTFGWAHAIQNRLRSLSFTCTWWQPALGDRMKTDTIPQLQENPGLALARLHPGPCCEGHIPEACRAVRHMETKLQYGIKYTKGGCETKYLIWCCPLSLWSPECILLIYPATIGKIPSSTPFFFLDWKESHEYVTREEKQLNEFLGIPSALQLEETQEQKPILA